MRRYDDQVEVRRGPVAQAGPPAAVDAPAQFLWRGRVWKVRAVLAHWVETAPWWQSSGARAVIGTETDGEAERPESLSGPDLVAERELWRVVAGRGPEHHGVFELAFSGADGDWQLVGCAD